MENSLPLDKTIHLKYTIKVENKPFYELVSACLDKVISLVGLVISIPILVIIALAIKLEDRGPIFYKQERLGKDGKVFWMYKIRSMKIDAEKNGAQWADQGDRRITSVGRFIRRTRLDEVPQLLNILIGQMSLIGPRPERPELTLKFYGEHPEFVNRLIIKPGLTGWAQVNGGYDITSAEKIVFDIYYVKNRSVKLDFRIVLKTIQVIFSGNGAR